MLCLGSVKMASPNSAALRIFDPSVSLESVVFLLPGVGVPQRTLRLPTDSGPPDRPRLKGCRFGPNKLGILFLGVGLPLTEMTEHFINGEASVRLDKPYCRAEATPFPMPWMLDRLGPNRIQHHIAADLQKVSVL